MINSDEFEEEEKEINKISSIDENNDSIKEIKVGLPDRKSIVPNET